MKVGRDLPNLAKKMQPLIHARVHYITLDTYLTIFMYMVEYAKLTTLFFSLM